MWGQLRERRPQRGFRRKESKKFAKTRLASLDAAEALRKPKGSAGQDTQIYVDWKRERAPVQGLKGSDIPAQFSGETHGGVVKGTLGVGKVRREWAPATGATDSDNPTTSLDTCDASDDEGTSETVTGKRE